MTMAGLAARFGDEHVNAIIRQALAVPSFTLVIVDPNASWAGKPARLDCRRRDRGNDLWFRRASPS